MSDIAFDCPHCNKHLEAEERSAGFSVPCSQALLSRQGWRVEGNDAIGNTFIGDAGSPVGSGSGLTNLRNARYFSNATPKYDLNSANSWVTDS